MQIAYGTDKLEGKQGIDLCRFAYDEGYRIFDTALAYSSQNLLGKALYKYAPRSNITIISKIAKPDIDKFSVRGCVEKILHELKTDFVDILLIHAPKGVNHKQVLLDMMKMQQEQKILKIGVSNYTIKHLEILKDYGIHPQVSQMEIHPYLVENEYVSYCRDNFIDLFSHSSLANGQLINDKTLEMMAEEHNCTLAQLVLSWSITRGIIPIVSSKNVRHIASNSATNLKILPHDLMINIGALNKNMRICNSSVWGEFI